MLKTTYEMKKHYMENRDNIWEGRYNSPFLIRRYIHRTQYHTVLKYVEQLNPNLILDYGCGEGVLSTLVTERGFKVIGIDISRPNIDVAKRVARQKGLEINFLIGDGENLPFKDKSFDLVIASHVLEHLPDIKHGFEELQRVADWAIVSVPTCLGLSSFSILGGDSPWALSKRTPVAFFYGMLRVLKNLGQDGVMEKYSGKDYFPHLWFYPWKFRRALEKAGFCTSKVEADSLCPPYISWLFPKSIQLFEFIDRFKDRKILSYFGYGTTYLLSLRK